jgi:hypothetical protein
MRGGVEENWNSVCKEKYLHRVHRERRVHGAEGDGADFFEVFLGSDT